MKGERIRVLPLVVEREGARAWSRGAGGSGAAAGSAAVGVSEATTGSFPGVILPAACAAASSFASIEARRFSRLSTTFEQLLLSFG